MIVALKKVDPIDITDLRILYALLLERKPWQAISHKKMPTFGEHRKFVKSNPYLAWYIIYAGEEAVGSTYITRDNELGIFIFDRFKGRGYGKGAVRLMMDMYGRPLYANINPLNDASKEFFTSLGFTPLQVTYVLE